MRAWTLCCFHSRISIETFRRTLGEQLRGDRDQCPFSGVTSSSSVLQEGAVNLVLPPTRYKATTDGGITTSLLKFRSRYRRCKLAVRREEVQSAVCVLRLLAGFLFHFLFLPNSFSQFACLAGSLCFDITWFVSLRFYNLCASPARLGLLLGSSLFVFTIYVPRHLAWVYFLDRPYSFLQTAFLPCSLSFTPWIVPIRPYSFLQSECLPCSLCFTPRFVPLRFTDHYTVQA